MHLNSPSRLCWRARRLVNRMSDTGGGPAAPARPGHAARKHCVPLGDRVRRSVPLLHEHLRAALDPRSCAGDRHRAVRHAARPRCVGGHRRRRCPVDRRQPPDPCAAPQRADDDPDVQQPDLRPDEGPVLADLGGRQGDQVHSVRGFGLALQPAELGDRSRGLVCRPDPRHGPKPHDGDLPTGARAPRGLLRRGLPELQRVQRWRFQPDHVPRQPRLDADPAPPRRAHSLRARRHAPRGRAAVGWSPGDRRGDRSQRGRPPGPRRAARGPEPRLRPLEDLAVRSSRRRSACSGPSSGRSTGRS